MTYEFKGYNWTELAECWGIKAEERPLIKGSENQEDWLMVPETIDISYHINNTSMVFTTSDSEEVLAEKLKVYILEHMLSDETEQQIQMRRDMNSFLEALVKETQGLNYSTPAYRGILAIESNHTFAQWFCHNLEKKMWK